MANTRGNATAAEQGHDTFLLDDNPDGAKVSAQSERSDAWKAADEARAHANESRAAADAANAEANRLEAQAIAGDEEVDHEEVDPRDGTWENAVNGSGSGAEDE